MKNENIAYSEFNNSQKAQKACAICHKSLQIHDWCWRCQRGFCQRCDQKNNKENKMCFLCYEDAVYTLQIQRKNKFKWRNQSAQGDLWAKQLLDKDFKMLDEQYAQIISSIQKNKDQLIQTIPTFEKVLSDKVINLKGSGLNYSLQDFMSLIGFVDNEENLIPVRNILLAFGYTRPEIGYKSQMKTLAFFLLCFMKESIAYFCFLKLIAEIMPEKVWPDNINSEILNKRVKEITSITLKFNSVSKSESIRNKYEHFLQENLQKYYSCFMIGVVPFKGTYNYFVNLMKEKSFYCVDQFVMIISLINYDAIVNENNDLHRYILQNTSQKQINSFEIQLNQFLDNVNSINEVYSLYKKNERLKIQREKLIEMLCNLQIEQKSKEMQHSLLESEIDITKFVTEIGDQSIMQEEKKLEANITKLKEQLIELQNKEADLKTQNQNGEEDIKKLIVTKEEVEQQSKTKRDIKDVIEMKYITKKNQITQKIKQLENDLKQQDLDIAARTKMVEARKKILLNTSPKKN